jgi:hypothetical protein
MFSTTSSVIDNGVLALAVGRVRTLLTAHCERVHAGGVVSSPSAFSSIATEAMRGPDSPVTLLCERFGLTPFELDVVLFCAAMELDPSLGALCAEALGNPRRTMPTFNLAAAVLDGSHWDAIAPDRPLRYWRLIEISGHDGTQASASLRVDERILQFLLGSTTVDRGLPDLLEPLVAGAGLYPSGDALARRVAALIRTGSTDDDPPVIQLCGSDVDATRRIAAAACAELGIRLFFLPGANVPHTIDEQIELTRRWMRDVMLEGGMLLIDCDGDGSRQALALVERMKVPLLVATREPLGALRNMIAVEITRPTHDEQQQLWTSSLGEWSAMANGEIASVAAQFRLGARGIVSAAAEVASRVAVSGGELAGGMLWDACRVQARSRLDELARRVESTAGWSDLVLPDQQKLALREIVAHVRQRMTVYEQWGFGRKSHRGLGTTALFAGASGTGKTLAAEVIANTLRLDLYHIDLSQIVSKYIGETEKNLRRIFYAADEGGAILLFDEADALFGKRSDVKDSHDRYANVEVSYLLQRMESYRGLAILTTNMKQALDTAFLRRLKFVVNFPFPDAAQRAEIWWRTLPESAPTDGIDAVKLSSLTVSGGSIWNIALNAAFLAAESREPIRMRHMLQAARTEYMKLDKPLSEGEIRGWV